MAYTIKEIARLGNVSTRTMRYYDEIGLLQPAYTGKNGYRYYDRQSLLVLQQILFFREMGMPLKDVADILQMPEFNLLVMLKSHREALLKELTRIKKLITTIDDTISRVKGDKEMAEKELFNGFDEDKYAQESHDRWGGTEQFSESQKCWASYSDAEKKAIKEKGGEITIRMVGTAPGIKPGNEGVQKAIGDYLSYLNKYFYTCDVKFLRELSKMWVEDPRFAVNYEQIREGGAQFVREAVEIYCQTVG